MLVMHLVKNHGEREDERLVDAGVDPRGIRVPPEERAAGRVLAADPRDDGAIGVVAAAATSSRDRARAGVVAASLPPMTKSGTRSLEPLPARNTRTLVLASCTGAVFTATKSRFLRLVLSPLYASHLVLAK